MSTYSLNDAIAWLEERLASVRRNLTLENFDFEQRRLEIAARDYERRLCKLRRQRDQRELGEVTDG